jgi:hypothetical protein
MTDLNAYLEWNRTLARQLAGARVLEAVRLLDIELTGSPLEAWGGVLLELTDGRRYVIDCDESLANIILFDVPPDGGKRRDYLARYPIRVPLFGSSHPFHVLLEQAISDVEVMSRDAADSGHPHLFEMCGLRLTMSGGARICIGTHLETNRYGCGSSATAET